MVPRHQPLPAELRSLLPATLHGLCEQRRYERGALLFETGRRPGSMFFISDGEVTLQRIGEDGEIVVLQRTRHGLVGEASLQSDRYHCDAVIVADANVVRIPRQALLGALTSDAAFALSWIGMLNKEVRRLRQQCERLSLNTVEARLLHLIRTEGDASGLSIGAGLKTVAREMGVSHEALYRCVAALERRGLLTRRDGRLCLRSGSAGAPDHTIDRAPVGRAR
jgi:CRP/FNR family transcriptional regulator, dissimilatory nitrate respiration regulator